MMGKIVDRPKKKKQEHFGFSSYLETGKITQEFITDFEYWSKKIFYHWKFYIPFEEFQSTCWEALLSKLPEFDPNIATIQTFCLSRINNECLRLYMKNKQKKVEIDCENPVLQSELIADDDKTPFLLFTDFTQYALKMGVIVNVDELYNDYKEGINSPGMIAYASWRLRNKEVEGSNDFSKRRCTAR